MEVLVLDGKSYVKASKAARDLGYASDYVGQLCRSGQVDAHLIGRTWYVNPDELGTHRFEKKRLSRVKAREQAKKAIEEHRLKVVEEPNNYRNIDIRYESDERELIPETKKLEVQSVTVRRKGRREPEPEYDSETVIENRGNKVRMSGDLTVVDVTDGPIETDTVLLTPGRIRSGTVTVTPLQERTPEAQIPINAGTPDEATTEEERPAYATFMDRVQAATGTEIDNVKGETEYPDVSESTESEGSSPAKSNPESTIPYVLTCLVLAILVLAALPATKTISYSESTGVLISYHFSFDEFVSLIKLKI